MRLWNFRGEQNTITEALRLSIPDHAVISLTGSGGKTSLLFAWARELAGSGKRVVVTTTTHMANPGSVKDSTTGPSGPSCSSNPWDGIRVVYTTTSESSEDISSCIEDISGVLDECGIVMAVAYDTDRPYKVSAPTAQIMEQLYKLADVILIEADGSRRMPLKWPAPWEPVVPDNTDITVCIAGLSSLGRNPEDVMYRYEHLPQELRRDTVDESLISTVLASLDGGQKESQGEFRVFLNQADSEALQKSASRIQQILGLYGIQSAWGMLKNT